MSKYSNALVRKNWEKHGENPSLNDWGALPDYTTLSDAAITASDNTLTVSSATFAKSDVGKFIAVAGAGIAGANLLTTIATYTSGTEVELTDAASTTVSGANAALGTDNTINIQEAFDECASHGVVLRLHFGSYMASNLTIPSNLHLIGSGENSTLICKPGAMTEAIPWIINESGDDSPTVTNTDITLEAFLADGNSNWQTVTKVDILALRDVQRVHIRKCTFQNALLRCVSGYDWLQVTIDSCRFSNWLPDNVISGETGLSGYGGAIQCQADYGADKSETIKILNCYVDGSISHSTCIKVSGSVSHKARDITITGNTCIPGYDAAGTLGIELWSTADPEHLGYEHFVIANNIVLAETTPNLCFGISTAGAGGLYGSITANVVRDCQAYSIEIASCRYVSAIGNSCFASGRFIVDSNQGGPCEHIVIANNTIQGPTIGDGWAAATARVGIYLYNGSIAGSTPKIQNCIVSGNTVDLTGVGQYGRGIRLEANDALAQSRDNQITNNVVVGDGTAGQRGIHLAESIGTLERTLVAFNTLRNLDEGIYQAGDYNRFFGNMFADDVTTHFSGTPGSNDQIVDILGAEAETFAPNALQIRGLNYPSIAADGSVYLGNESDLIHFATASAEESIRNPNALYLNRVNYGAETQGGILSANSKFIGQPNWQRACKAVIFTADAGTDTLTSTAHGWINDERLFVYNSGGALPSGLSAETRYWVVNKATDTFQLSATQGGAAIDITDAGSGTQYATKSVYAMFVAFGATAFRIGFDDATNAKGAAVGIPTPGTSGDRGALRVTETGVYSDLAFFPQYNYGPGVYSGDGTPEGNQTAAPGSLYLDDDGDIWYKKTGTGNTGWVQLTGLWESIDSDTIGTEYKVQIVDDGNNRPLQLLIQGNDHANQGSTPLLLLKKEVSTVKTTTAQVDELGNAEFQQLTIDSQDDSQPTSVILNASGHVNQATTALINVGGKFYVFSGGFVGVGVSSAVGGEKFGVVGDVHVDGDLNLHTGHVLKVEGTQVLATQQAAIANFTYGSVGDTADMTYTVTERDMLNNLRNLVNEIRADSETMKAVLRSHGLIAT